MGSLNIGNEIVRNVMDICNWLNNYYCNVRDKLVQSLGRTEPNNFTQYCSLSNLQSMLFNPVDPNEIERIIMSLKNNKSSGIDDIGPKILKEVCPEIVNPLAYIFDLSLSTILIVIYPGKSILIICITINKIYKPYGHDASCIVIRSSLGRCYN